jgi:predicted nucleic acid-binding Zn ribbon protein
MIDKQSSRESEPALVRALKGEEFPPAEKPKCLCSGRISASWAFVGEVNRPDLEPWSKQFRNPHLYTVRDWQIWDDKQAPRLEVKRSILADFCRVKTDNRSEIEGFIGKHHILPPIDKPEELVSSFKFVYISLRPIFHKILLQEDITAGELSTVQGYVGEKKVYTVDAGDDKHARPVDLISFGGTFSILCQFALDVYACSKGAGRTLAPVKECCVCGHLVPPGRRSNAKSCSEACSRKLKEENRKRRYHSDPEYRQRRMETALRSRNKVSGQPT